MVSARGAVMTDDKWKMEYGRWRMEDGKTLQAEILKS
jgi:hypothetical protein